MAELPKAGADLDRRVAREIFGVEDPKRVPPYSTDDAAADLVIAKLQSSQVRCDVQEIGERWLCVWWIKIEGKRTDASERISTSTARTRALAICRSALVLSGARRREGDRPPPPRS